MKWRCEKAVFRIKPLAEYMRMVPDPRCGRKKKHDMAEVLTCLVVKKNQPLSYEETVRQFGELEKDRERLREDRAYRSQYPELMEKYDEATYAPAVPGRQGSWW